MEGMKKLWAEAIGTFCLVFAGTGALVVNAQTRGAVTHVGVCLVFGLVIAAMIAALGDVSGAHFNPAVTLGFRVAKRFEGRLVLPYLFAQFAGAIAASLVLRLLFPLAPDLGATHPSGSSVQSFVLEAILTAILMFVILGVSSGAAEKGLTAGLSIGAVVALEALFAGPICGASMNPARSLAPALVGWQLSALWIYIIAPVIGAGIGVVGCRLVREEGCCG